MQEKIRSETISGLARSTPTHELPALCAWLIVGERRLEVELALCDCDREGDERPLDDGSAPALAFGRALGCAAAGELACPLLGEDWSPDCAFGCALG